MEYLQASVSVLAYVALADNEIKSRELGIIREIYARAGVSADDLREVVRIVEQCERRFVAAGSDPERLYRLLRDACAAGMRHSNEQTRFSFFRTAILIAANDGFVRSSENGALEAVASWLGISPLSTDRAWRSTFDHDPARFESADYESAEQPEAESRRDSREEPIAPPDLAMHYASILGVSKTASPQALKRAYRDKAKQCHPDILTHRGAASAREAEERFKELSEAYAFFRRRRPWRRSHGETSVVSRV
jgi:DnaJ-domain-containing protein 1